MRDKGTNPSSADSGCGLYVHIPFCETKCGYCDFYSVALKDRDPRPLVDRVIGELADRVEGCPIPVRTVFCGGGTPTLLPLPDLAALLSAIQRVVAVATLEEFTVEANPATIDDDKARLLVSSGVTRVSMGAQSFFADELEALERIHRVEDIAPSVEILRRNGVSQINLDLIFGIPGQTLDTWSDSLGRAVALEPDHLACYGLTYEPGTKLTAQRNHQRIRPCDENLEADMFLLTRDRLPQAGYTQYEISNYARPGCQSAHNINYWRNGSYIGVGPSAAGYLNNRRYKNIADVAGYVRMIDAQGHAEAETETLDRSAILLETIMMQLRLTEGMSILSFRERVGVDPLELFSDTLARLVKGGLVARNDDHIALTRQGQLVANAVIRDLAVAGGRADISLPIMG
ncbi:MAG: radical SAM family heme chaperone HemW [Planctomycetes bacterium]|nr:radical SAM family heme chaperone HemW [Planctomycetota bacterium]